MNWLDLPEQLFDLRKDPTEIHDLGREAGSARMRSLMRDRLLDFLARRNHRAAVSDELVASCTDTNKKGGVFYGQWYRAMWQPSWRESGQEPDYRFSLPNKRTFLAWVRSALSLLAGGELLVRFATRLSPAGWPCRSGWRWRASRGR